MGIVLFPLFPLFKSLSIFAAFSVLGLFVVIFLAPERQAARNILLEIAMELNLWKPDKS